MKNTKIVYIIVYGLNATLLENEVNERIKQGFIPQGGVSTSWLSLDVMQYTQAMILPSK